jgi:uncharacterized protein YjbI with pentapeptide repeats
MAESALVGLSVTDVRWNGCDAANSDWTKAIMMRVEFLACRLTGIALGLASLRHVRFRDCKVDMASLRFIKCVAVEFVDCVLPGADFGRADLSGVRFDGCDLRGADFSHATVAGADFRGSRLDDIKGAAGMHGARIDHGQLLELAPYIAAEIGLIVD